jgi:eukaryotic-like serine/threonine-protein kinase
MDPTRLQQLRDLFEVALGARGNGREHLLEQRASEDPELVEHVRKLLQADQQAGIMDALAPHLSSVAQVLIESMPGRIGAYHVVSELGRGGMGVVYLADRADGEFQQRVAIKLIGTSNTDDPLHQRFLAERQILAGLIHPNIARLQDGGVTDDGRPYLVMEYVDGLPMTVYCDNHRLDVPARLRLFADVCAAVQHAHQNLVIHRDLKPSNILVSTDGRVHLLDFGIAKLINPSLVAAQAPVTRFEPRMMTPEYASPEQVRGESLTTASDIYSLGVLLYELLCGCPPYRLTAASPVEVAAAICEQDPERPSARATRIDRGGDASEPEVVARLRGTSVDRLTRQLQGDLDGIVLMAMRKEPGRRYASADMLRQDVERHLAGLPVLAHRGSHRYQVGKFLRRHRVEAAAAAIVLVTLASGLSIAIAQGRLASRERDRAEQALAESTGVTNFLLELFQGGETEGSRSQLSALDLLQRGARRADELSDQPIVQARLLDVVGRISYHLGRLDDAQRRLERAVATRRTTPGATPLDLAASLIHLSWVHRIRDDQISSRKLLTEALEIRRAALPEAHPDIGDALYELGAVSPGREQERLYREAIDIAGRTPATTERQVRWLGALATNLRRQGRLSEAVATARNGLVVAEQALGAEHHIAGFTMIHVADHVKDIEQDFASAERLYRRGLELMVRHYGDSSSRLIHGLNGLAAMLGSQGKDEAEQLLRRALSISESATGPEHPQVAEQMHRLANELARQRRLSEAETLSRRALDLSTRVFGQRHQVVAARRMPLLARVLDLQGRHSEADATYRLALEQFQPLPIVVRGEMHRDYGAILFERGQYPHAEQQLLSSLTLLEKVYTDHSHPNLQETKRALMRLYQRLGNAELVERYRVPPGRFIAY